jgi:DNA-binding MarR family transcriptional regulator
VLVEATAAGRRLLNRARLKRIDAVAARLSDLSERDLAIVRRAAELLEERFATRPWRPAEDE